MVFRQSFFVASSVAILMLGACSNNASTPETANISSPAASNPAASPSPDTASGTAGESGSKHGGQVVKSGDYHLEFVPSKEGDGTHLDFFLYKGDLTEIIPDAKVTAKVEFPDGSQQDIDLPYEPAGKHYGKKMPDASMPGDYNVAILTDINGEKINGRFSFKQ
ncbi:MAG: hypothetical protein HC866_24035 [Leptolyngbyaceae cyanobacterium RU_5_1]|nr:hypothetical protein [Leptolyngbyaceae cyanobacterium RU_5_1]